MKYLKKYLLYLTLIIFPLIGLLNSFRFKFPLGTDTSFHYFISKTLLGNNFLLSKTIPFFWDGFFAGYPPLFHYVAAFISKIFSLDLLLVYKFLPWLFFSLLLLALYIFIKEFDKKYALLAVIIFTIIPIYLHAFYAGELARLPGLAFSLFCLASVKKYLKTNSKKELIFSGIFYSLTILSHLYAAAITSVILAYWIIEQYIVKKDYSITLTLFLGIIISSPWLIFITKNFGLLYFFKVFAAHSTDVASFVPYIAIILLMLPIIKGLWKRKFYSIILIFLILSIISRMFIMIPISYYLSKQIHLRIFKKNKKIKSLFIMILLIISIMIFSSIMASQFMKPLITEQKIQATDWIKQNTNQNQTVLAYLDYFYVKATTSEYLFDNIIGHAVRQINGFDNIIPALTQRKTYTWFAFEWSLDKKRKTIIDEFREKLCKEHFFKTAVKYNIYPDYLWFAKEKNSSRYTSLICNDLTEPEFEKVFSNKEVDIYKINY